MMDQYQIEQPLGQLRVIVLYPQLFASPIVNILTPLRQLAQQGCITLDHCREDQVTPQQVRSADLIVACRSVSPTFKPIYEYAQSLGTPIIYDLDDNLLAVPKESQAYRYFGHPDKQKQLRWMLEQVDLVRVYSPALIDIVHSMNPHVELAWSAIDWSLVPETLPELRQPLEIVYAVSPYSGEMFYPIIRNAMKRILNDFADRVHFSMLGYKDPELAKLPNCEHVPFENQYEVFFRSFARHGYAIGLAPMKYDLFYECKTDLKFRDYAAAGAVGVFTNSPLYRQVQGGVTGILIENDDNAWYNAIVDLLQNPDKIVRIRKAARQFAHERYHIDVISAKWLNDLYVVQKKSVDTSVIHPVSWWFTRSGNMAQNRTHRLKHLYHRVMPFKAHIVISRVYHQMRRLLASITQMPR